MSRRQQAFDYFRSMGWSPEQAAGIVANLEAESGLRPDAVGDGGLARGLPQWHPDRQSYVSALLGKQFDQLTFEDQLYGIHAELMGPEKRAGDALAACTTAAEAGAVVSIHYERPKDREGEAEKRAALATQILAQMSGGQMLPVIGAAKFLPEILSIVPALVALFGKGEKGAKTAQAAQVVVDAFTKAVPGAVNAQDAVEKAQADPAVAAAAKAAILADPAVLGLIEVGGGVVAARKMLIDISDGDWHKAALNLISVPMMVIYMLIPLVYYTVAKVYTSTGELSFTAEIRAMVVSAIISGVLFGITGFALGTSFGSQKKDAMVQASMDRS